MSRHFKHYQMKIYLILYASTVVLTGLLAGLFYGYSCSVNKGLGHLSDENYLRAFQSINRVILNPTFFLSFGGSFFLLVASVIVSRSLGQTLPFYWFLAALLIYVVAVAGVTISGNVPLNDQLDAFDLSSASNESMAALRRTFERPWNKFHAVRTIASLLSFGCTVIGVLNGTNK